MNIMVLVLHKTNACARRIGVGDSVMFISRQCYIVMVSLVIVMTLWSAAEMGNVQWSVVNVIALYILAMAAKPLQPAVE